MSVARGTLKIDMLPLATNDSFVSREGGRKAGGRGVIDMSGTIRSPRQRVFPPCFVLSFVCVLGEDSLASCMQDLRSAEREGPSTSEACQIRTK